MIRNKVFIWAIILILFPALSYAQKIVPQSQSDISLKNEAQNAIGRGLTWISTKQTPGGV